MVKTDIDIVNEQDTVLGIDDVQGQAEHPPDPFAQAPDGDPVLRALEFQDDARRVEQCPADRGLIRHGVGDRSIEGSTIFKASITRSSSGVSTTC